jgi:hypothetical protein
MSDEAKRRILARRARFVAAAMTGAAVACGKEKAEPPQPCLSVVYVPPDAGAEAAAPPAPCLTVAPPSPAVPDAGAHPRPCLSIAPIPKDAGKK